MPRLNFLGLVNLILMLLKANTVIVGVPWVLRNLGNILKLVAPSQG